jgi:adenosylhomocysteine nucleosidase
MTGQTGGGPMRVAPPPVPSDIGVVAALPIEVGMLLARLREVRKYAGARHTIHEGFCGEHLVSLIVTGPGRAAALRGAETMIGGHRPRWLLSVGFAGALDPALKRNTLVVPDRVTTLQGDAIRIDLHPSEPGQPPPPGCRLVTVDQIVRTVQAKAQLRAETQADAVDMETHAVASFAADRGLRFLAVRVISDDANSELPPEILSLVGPTGGYRMGAALGAVWKRPSSVMDMLVLRDRAHQAARVLAETVPAILQRLP